MKKVKWKPILIIILVILIMVLVSFIGFLILGKDYFSNENPSIVEKEDQTGEGLEENIPSKEYVYDADYQYQNQYQEFVVNRDSQGEKDISIDFFGIPVSYHSGTQYLKDLKVPYINMDSEDAKKVNENLKNLYMDYAKNFDQCAIEEMGCHQILTYRIYSYQDILSVVVIYGTQSTSTWVLDYQTYNFDLETENLMSYNDLLERLEYDKDDVLENLRNSMDDFYKVIYVDADVNSCKRENSDIMESCSDISIQLFEESIKDGSVLFFVNDIGSLNILAIPYFNGVQNGTVNHYLFEIIR